MRRMLLMLPLLFLSCKNDEDPIPEYPKYFFFNDTGVDIDLVVYRNFRFDEKKFHIPSENGKSLLVIGYDQSVPKSKVPTGFPPLPYPVEYIFVIFNKTDTLIHSPGIPKVNSLFDESSYEFLMVEEKPAYDFIFSENDYENAKK